MAEKINEHLNIEMKLLSWNVNSIRSRLGHIEKIISEESPDILCLQETKVENDKFPKKFFNELGYKFIHINGIKAYNGVCIITKQKSEKDKIVNWCDLNDGRHISIKISKIHIHNLYIPAGGEEPNPQNNKKFEHKLNFLDELINWSRKNKKNKTILCGDFNIAPNENDVWSHKQLINTVSHTPIEIKKLNEFLNTGPWIDLIKEKIFPPSNLFTWWSYRSPDYKKSNRGRRLDHFWCSLDLKSEVKTVRILKHTRDWKKPSDHVPVLINLKKIKFC